MKKFKKLPEVSPAEFRTLVREGKYSDHTSGVCAGFAQANLVVLEKELALDFMIFAQRNPKPCPVLDVTDVGSYKPPLMAPGADLRRDIPGYHIYRQGELVAKESDIRQYWRDDLVAFLLGCSFSFESALLKAEIPLRHLEAGRNVAMYITNLDCHQAGVFSGPTVVSMRPIPRQYVEETIQITSRFPRVHGAPIQVGDHEKLGISNLAEPDFGDPPVIKPGDVPVFWACGVTPQAVAKKVKPELMITHAPGKMFVTDVKNEELLTTVNNGN